MRTVLVTGASGFIGKNLCAHLRLRDDIALLELNRGNSAEDISEYVGKADFIYHLAGANRPKNDNEFIEVNHELTERIVTLLRDGGKSVPVLFTSSVQADLDNPYGQSKVLAEKTLTEWSKESQSPIYIYRLPGVFGKWCKPNYNSVVATFCHNIANELPVEISDPANKITLVYIDTIIDEFLEKLDSSNKPFSGFCEIPRCFEITLGELKDRIVHLHDIRSTLVVPNLEDKLDKYLYATYVSYFSKENFSYELDSSTDDRGSLTEFIKSKQFGQVFISTTKPGISRGDHWHNTKIEKFFVLDGEAEITFRNKVLSQDIIRYGVSGDIPTVVDIPTGYVHAIKNIGTKDLITIFWANEMLDKTKPDTFYEKVLTGGKDE
jgi:UDP-2-acetamido-2,6-beta-L-arabino-hexul-4-ose reductase